MRTEIKLIILLSLLTFSCNNNDPFKGESYYHEYTKHTKSIKGQKITFNDINTGDMLVFDSLVIFSSPKYPDFSLNVFNEKNGDVISRLIPKGNGPYEYSGTSLTHQIIHKENQTSIIIYAYNKQEIIEIDLQNLSPKNCYIHRKPFKWSENFNKPYNYIFKLDENKILAKIPAMHLFENGTENHPPKYLIVDINTQETEREYTMYQKSISSDLNKEFAIDVYYLSTDRVKPDGSKLVCVQGLLAQISILDLNNFKSNNYRIANTSSPEYLYGDTDNYHLYYKSCTVSDDYIYCLYVNQPFKPRTGIPSSNIVHVWDWNGNFISEIHLDKQVDQIEFDLKDNILYGKNNITDEVYVFQDSH